MARAFLHPCAREAGVRCRRLAVDLPPRRRRARPPSYRAERVTAAQDIAISRDEAAATLPEIAEAPEAVLF